LQWKKL